MKTQMGFVVLLALIVTACGAESFPTIQPTSAPVIESPLVQPSATPTLAVTETAAPVLEAENLSTFDEMGIAVGFDYPDGFTQGINTAVIGVYEPQAPFDLSYPQHAQILFTGYTSDTLPMMLSGIRVFRVDEINALEAGVIESLDAVREEQADHLSDFPRFAGAGTLIDAQLAPLSFQNGEGYRYLFTKAFDAAPVSSTALTYMFQGVTSDEKYFVSFIMTVQAPFLAEYINQPLATVEEFEAYYQIVNERVNTSNPDAFEPALTALDELVASIVVNQK